MLKFVLVFISFLSFFCFGASNERIQSYLKLDTVFHFTPTNILYRDELCLSVFEEELWVYFPDKREDTLDFTVINLSNFKIREEFCVFPTMYFKVYSPIASDMTVSKDRICLAFEGGNSLVLLDRCSKKIRLNQILPVKEKLRYLKINGDYLYFGNHYNYHPKDSEYKTLLGKYNLKTGYLEEIIYPNFNGIEFSHFLPMKWIAFGDQISIFSQTMSYDFVVYDSNLQKLDSIVYPNPPGWRPIPPEKFKSIIEGVSTGKPLIYALEAMEDTLTRIEGVYLISDAILAVQQVMNVQQGNSQIRLIDFWKRDKNGKFLPYKMGLRDVFFDLDEMVTKDNYPVVLFNHNYNLFTKDKLIQWNFETEFSLLNKSIKEIQKEAGDYYMEKDDVYAVKIFSIHDL